VQHLKGSEVERLQHRAHVAELRKLLIDAGLPVMRTKSHILPLIIGDAVVAQQLTDDLLHEFGIYCQPINYPTVARGTERLRLTPSPIHTPAMMAELRDALLACWERYGLALGPF